MKGISTGVFLLSLTVIRVKQSLTRTEMAYQISSSFTNRAQLTVCSLKIEIKEYDIEDDISMFQMVTLWPFPSNI